MSDAWRALLPELENALARHGVTSTRAWLRARPRQSHLELADVLGTRALLLRRYLRDVAAREGWLDELACDALVRELHRALPDGWGRGHGDAAMDQARADALAGWVGTLDRRVDAGVRDAARWLDENAPIGWLPADIDDPLVVGAVARILPVDGRGRPVVR